MATLQYSDKIQFNSINKRPKLNRLALKSWLLQIIKDNGYECMSVSYNFCSDDYLLKINQEHLNHDYLTDIITFDLSDSKKTIEADIYISVDRVKDNANTLGVVFENELRRVVVHGLLHLMGQGDKTKKEKEQMRLKEDRCLSTYKNHVPRETVS